MESFTTSNVLESFRMPAPDALRSSTLRRPEQVNTPQLPIGHEPFGWPGHGCPASERKKVSDGDEAIEPQTPAGLRMSLKAKLNAKARERGSPRTRSASSSRSHCSTADSLAWTVINGWCSEEMPCCYAREASIHEGCRSGSGQRLGRRRLLVELRDIVGRDVGVRITLEVDRVEPHDHRDQYGYGRSPRRRTSASSSLAMTSKPSRSICRHAATSTDRSNTSCRSQSSTTESIRGLPAVPVVPIENHLAAKVCAMFEIHREGQPSTRYRDLADLVSGNHPGHPGRCWSPQRNAGP